MSKQTPEQWMAWYNAKTPEQKLEFNQHRYKRDKVKYALRREKLAKEKRDAKPKLTPAQLQEKKDRKYWRQRACAHNHDIKKRYPQQITEKSPSHDQLFEWILAQPKVCRYCGNPPEHIDHTVPMVKGGLHELDNMTFICMRCNRAKYNSLEADFLDWLDRLSAFRN